MPISLDPIPPSPATTAVRPLAGMTVLVVEDSRFASEAVRLLCLKSGARIRRADSLRAAHRHLAVYMPTVIIVDLGLPDGSGLELIKNLAEAQNRIPVILATSGDETLFDAAVAAGADGILPKPIENLASFQEVVVNALPDHLRPSGLRLVTAETVEPDPIAFQDDLAHIADLLSTSDDQRSIDYITQFLTGVARSANDDALEAASITLASRAHSGDSYRSELAQVAGMIQTRLENRKAI